jgi:phosphohistidine phosphatase
MRRLILFRHAKAEARAPSGEDIDRALAASGRQDATTMGQVLASEGLSPDLVLVSSARRTQETWECLAPAFPRAKARLCEALYNASVEEILEEVQTAAPEAATMMVVAHNPGLHELAVELMLDACASASEIDKVAARFPTSTAVAFQIDGEGRPSPDGLFHAKDFGGGDE